MTYRPTAGQLPERDAIPASYMWDLQSHLCELGRVVRRAIAQLDAAIEAFKTRQGTLASGP